MKNFGKRIRNKLCFQKNILQHQSEPRPLPKPMRRPAKLMRITCCIYCPKSRRNFYRIKCCLRRRYQLMNNKHSSSYSAGQTFNYKNVAACNKFCLPLSRLGPMNMPDCLTASLTACLPPKKKTKRTTTTKISTSRRRGENSTICHFVGPPLFVLFWAKKCALQKVARSSLSLC